MNLKNLIIILIIASPSIIANDIKIINQADEKVIIRTYLQSGNNNEKELAQGERLVLPDHRAIESIAILDDNAKPQHIFGGINFNDAINKQKSFPLSPVEKLRRAMLVRSQKIEDYSRIKDDLKKDSATISYKLTRNKSGYHLEQIDTLSGLTLEPEDLNFEKIQLIAPQCQEIYDLKGIEIDKEIGAGFASGGIVFQVCLGKSESKDCTWALKKAPISNYSFKDFINGCEIQEGLDRSIAPKSLGCFVCSEGEKTYGIHVMKKVDGDLNDYLDKYSSNNKVIIQLLQAVKNLHNVNVVHNDLHGGNIAYSIDPKEGVKFFTIDFDKSYKYKSDDIDEKSDRVDSFFGDRGNENRNDAFLTDIKDILSYLRIKFGLDIALYLNGKNKPLIKDYDSWIKRVPINSKTIEKLFCVDNTAILGCFTSGSEMINSIGATLLDEAYFSNASLFDEPLIKHDGKFLSRILEIALDSGKIYEAGDIIMDLLDHDYSSEGRVAFLNKILGIFQEIKDSDYRANPRYLNTINLLRYLDTSPEFDAFFENLRESINKEMLDDISKELWG